MPCNLSMLRSSFSKKLSSLVQTLKGHPVMEIHGQVCHCEVHQFLQLRCAHIFAAALTHCLVIDRAPLQIAEAMCWVLLVIVMHPSTRSVVLFQGCPLLSLICSKVML